KMVKVCGCARHACATAPRTLISTPAGSRGPKRALTDRVENSKPAGLRAARSKFKAAKSHAAWMLSPKLSRPRWLILHPPACNPTRSSGDRARSQASQKTHHRIKAGTSSRRSHARQERSRAPKTGAESGLRRAEDGKQHQ